MCDTYSIIIQEKKNTKWVNLQAFEVPDETMPLCGCWLFNLNFDDESWQNIKLINTPEDFEDLKNKAIQLNDMVRNKIFEVMKEIQYNQRIIIERLI